MSRQVLTYPDIPPVLTQGVADTLYLPFTMGDAKGDLLVASGDNTFIRIPVGSNGQVLSADSASAGGVKWISSSGGGTDLWVDITGDTMTGVLTITPTVGSFYPTALVSNGSIGIGRTPSPVHPARRALFVGDATMLMSGAGYNATELRTNSYQDSANTPKPIVADLVAGSLAMVGDTLSFANAPVAAAGVTQTFTNRFSVSAAGVASVYGTRVGFEARDPAATAPARFGQFFGGPIAYVTANGVYNGTNWVLDDTTKDAIVAQFYGAIGAQGFSIDRFPAGANPPDSRRKRQLDLTAVGTLAVFPDAGQPGFSANVPYGAAFGASTSWAAFAATYPGIQIGCSTIWAHNTTPGAYWSSNSYYDGNRKAQQAGVGSELAQESSQLIFRTMANAAQGAVQTQTDRFRVASDGLVTITSGQQNSLTWAAGYGYLRTSNAAPGHAQIYSGGYLMLESASNYVLPERANAINLGSDGNYWATTFTRELKIMSGVNIQSINYQGLWDCIRDGADHVRFRRLGSGATWMRMIYSLAGVWFDEGITTPTINGSGALTLISPTDVTVNPASGVFVPSGDNAKACGWTTARWSTVHAANGSIQTSHVSQKKDFVPLDINACVQAVLDTDWLSYNYIDPNPPEPTPIPFNETNEARELRVNTDYAAMESYRKMVRETAFTRKQKGYVLGSPDYSTSEMFGLADRHSANTQADLAVVAAALQRALQRIAELEAKVN